jgi:Flp pilus assembly protein protease CpaA
MDLLGFYIGAGEIFSAENWFLIAIAVFWMIVASIQDIRKREVENWWNFSLIVFVLAFRAFVAVENHNPWYFGWGVLGLIAGFILANAFYYGRVFAGGDAKLMMALGAILPFSSSWQTNLEILVLFLILFLTFGSLYGIAYSFGLALMNFKGFKKEFLSYFRRYRKLILVFEIASLASFIAFFFFEIYLGVSLAIILLISPILLIYAKSIENAGMLKLVKIRDLTIGDWLAKPVRAGKNKVMPNWEGLNERQLKLIQNKCKGRILIKQGLPFVPSFLIAFIALLALIYYGIL